MDYGQPADTDTMLARNISLEHFQNRQRTNQSLSMRRVGVFATGETTLEHIEGLSKGGKRKKRRFLESIVNNHGHGRKRMETIPVIKAPWLNQPVDALEFKHLSTIVNDRR